METSDERGRAPARPGPERLAGWNRSRRWLRIASVVGVVGVTALWLMTVSAGRPGVGNERWLVSQDHFLVLMRPGLIGAEWDEEPAAEWALDNRIHGPGGMPCGTSFTSSRMAGLVFFTASYEGSWLPRGEHYDRPRFNIKLLIPLRFCALLCAAALLVSFIPASPGLAWVRAARRHASTAPPPTLR